MEELLQKADSKLSVFGSICQIFGLLGGASSLVAFFFSIETLSYEAAASIGAFGGSALIGAIGTSAQQSKKQSEFLKLIVQTQNSASELPN